MFSPFQLQELSRSIQRDNEVPLKFAYLNKGAGLWASTDSTQTLESVLLRGLLPRLQSLIGVRDSVTLIDIGSGSGESTWPILDVVVETGINLSYIPLDFSLELLQLASQNIQETYPDCTVDPHLLDFDDLLFAETLKGIRGDHSFSIFTLLGSTLCNQKDPLHILKSIQEAMHPEDILVVGIEVLTPEDKKVLNPLLVKQSNYDILFCVPELLGVNRQDGAFEASFNTSLNRAETRFVFTKEVKIAVREDEIIFKKGDDLLLMRVTDFTEQFLQETVTKAGLVIEERNDRKGYSVLVCRKKNISLPKMSKS